MADTPEDRPAATELTDEAFDGRARHRDDRESGGSPLADPGVSGGTAGTGGDNKVQDELDH